ncbi:MAG: hypothetical protein IKH90_05880 [Ruminococcus sp.]|nr:hypothetical protein [Ruminococcus sp.]
MTSSKNNKYPAKRITACVLAAAMLMTGTGTGITKGMSVSAAQSSELISMADSYAAQTFSSLPFGELMQEVINEADKGTPDMKDMAAKLSKMDDELKQNYVSVSSVIEKLDSESDFVRTFIRLSEKAQVLTEKYTSQEFAGLTADEKAVETAYGLLEHGSFEEDIHKLAQAAAGKNGSSPFEELYEAAQKECMFSGEALEQIQGAAQGILSHYVFLYAHYMVMLDESAQAASLSEQAVDALSEGIREKYDEIKDIINKADAQANADDQMNSLLFVLRNYSEVMGTDRNVYINKGEDFKIIKKTDHVVYEHTRYTTDRDISALFSQNTLSADEQKKIAQYCAEKYSFRTLLDTFEKDGITLPVSSYLVTGNIKSTSTPNDNGGYDRYYSYDGVLTTDTQIADASHDIAVYKSSSTAPSYELLIPGSALILQKDNDSAVWKWEKQTDENNAFAEAGYKATAYFNDGSEEAVVSVEKKVSKSCMSDDANIYTATVTHAGKTYTAQKSDYLGTHPGHKAVKNSEKIGFDTGKVPQSVTWRCSECSKLFLDKECTREITPAQVSDIRIEKTGSRIDTVLIDTFSITGVNRPTDVKNIVIPGVISDKGTSREQIDTITGGALDDVGDIESVFIPACISFVGARALPQRALTVTIADGTKLTAENIGDKAFGVGSTIKVSHSIDSSVADYLRSNQGYTVVYTDEHTPGEFSWEWSEDLTSANVKYKCAHCGSELEANAEVTSSEQGENTVYTAKAVIGGKEYTDSVTRTPESVDEARDRYGLMLSDSIDMRIDMDITAHVGTSFTDRARIVFTYPDPDSEQHKTKSETVALKNAKLNNGVFTKVISGSFAQMGDSVTVKIYDNSGNLVVFANGETKKQMSAAQYCSRIISNAQSYDEKTVTLAQAALDYGKAAKDHFGYEGEEIKGAKEAVIPQQGELTDTTQFKAGTYIKSLGETTFRAISQTELRFYTPSIAGGLKVVSAKMSASGEDLAPYCSIVKSGSGYCIRVTSLYATDLSDRITLAISDGTTITSGVGAYAAQVINSQSSNSEKLLAAALYRYAQAAKAYAA